MTSAEFVDRIKRAVYSPALEGTLSLLVSPPGRRPSSALVELSQWFNRLPADDQERVRQTIQLGVRGAVFGMLTTLDGARSILEPGETGSLELRYESDEGSVLLNDPTGEALHDLFADFVPPA